MRTEPYFPHVTVQLSGTDGNAFSILGRVRRALANANAEPQQIQAFLDDATASDYDHLLATCMDWVDVR